MTSNNLTPIDTHEGLSLKHTNVSNPSVVHSKPSKQSITASEDYYSLSSGSSQDTVLAADEQRQSTHSIQRFVTPPTRYRTPLQSRDRLPSQVQEHPGSQYAADEAADPEVRRTPMRGEGKRRSTSADAAAADAPATAAPLREGGIRRKPVPSMVMDGGSNSSHPRSQEYIDPRPAQSSVAQDIDREQISTTPGNDDTPYIRFALDQLTRDEEVRGSRQYPGDAFPRAAGPSGAIELEPYHEERQAEWMPGNYPAQGQDLITPAAAVGAAGVGAAAAPGTVDYLVHDREFAQPQRPMLQQQQQQQPLPSEQWPNPSRNFDEPPPRSSKRDLSHSIDQDQPRDLFVPETNEGLQHEPLKFVPGILRPFSLLLFIFLLLIILALLLTSAIWSLTHKGIFNYGMFGDGRYFICEYLPTILGMLLLVWLIQIQVGVYRIAPFIAMSSNSPTSWEQGAKLPICPKTWLLPYLGYFRCTGLGVVGFFMLVAWLQIWTIPLLASAFNVYFYGPPDTGIWRWVATTGVIWPTIILYLLLLISVVTLMFWLRRRVTGLKWDPRSLADMAVLLQNSNALNLTQEDEIRHEPARLSYWNTSRSGTNAVFHTYGIADRPARRYSLENGRILEKAPAPEDEKAEPKGRLSNIQDVDLGHEQRNSREKMLPRHLRGRSSSVYSDWSRAGARAGGQAVPWSLHQSAVLLWIIIAAVLLVAFLIISYLPATTVANGFSPLVPAPVNMLGFSSTNFLYSFIPTILAMLCYLGLLDLDYAYRRLQPLITLTADTGAPAKRSLLLSYPAELPLLVTASALSNNHPRIALLTLSSLLTTALPILAGGCFWAQFYVPAQNIRIYAHLPAYYALTAFLTIFALTIILALWPRHEVNAALPRANHATRWTDIVALVRGSRMLDDYHFRSPATKPDLVTRLLSSSSSGSDSSRPISPWRGTSRHSADEEDEVPRYFLGLYIGRDGREYTGIDRLRE